MNGSAMVLVQDGSASAVVVRGADVRGPALSAVGDFVRVIAEMSGGALPVVADGTRAAGGLAIHVGSTEYARARGLTGSELPENGFRIVCDGDTLVIAGGGVNGISHGVYSLLTDELGVLWGLPDRLFEDIPHRRTVEIARMDRRSVPAFGFRVFSGNDPDWVRRNRIDDGSRALPRFGYGHNLFRILPPSRYGDHSEYYALLDGKRRVPENDLHTHIQPCLTNPDVRRITVETARRFFDENPDVTTFSLCPNDSTDFCRCRQCSALDDTMDQYRGRRMNSNSYFAFVKAVADELLESHPDRYVGTYAYWSTELVPQSFNELPRNVAVMLTQDSSQYFDREYEVRDREILRKWSEFAANLGVYDYYGLGWTTPRIYTETVGRTLAGLPELGVTGFYCETYPFWAYISPQLFLATRLLWNPSADSTAILDEFYDRMFGCIASRVRRFHEILEDAWMSRLSHGRWFHGLDNVYWHIIHLLPGPRDEAWLEITEAVKEAEDETSRARADYLRRGYRFSYLLSRSYEAAVTLGRGDVAGARRVVSLARETFAVYRTAIEPDLSYGRAYYRGPRMDGYLEWWKTALGLELSRALGEGAEEAVASPLAAELLALAQDGAAHGRVEDTYRLAREKYGEDVVRWPK